MKRENWITKAEEKVIISTYEGFKGEIIPYGDPNDHMYEITTVRRAGDRSLGLITIKSEYIPEQKEQPRILVQHSDAEGKRTFTDVWERNSLGKLYWKYRNPVGVPISTRDAIDEKEHEISTLKGKLSILEIKYQKLIETAGATKPAGRPSHPEKLDAQAARVKELINQGLSEKEITEQLGIGRATYYRMKKRV